MINQATYGMNPMNVNMGMQQAMINAEVRAEEQMILGAELRAEQNLINAEIRAEERMLGQMY